MRVDKKMHVSIGQKSRLTKPCHIKKKNNVLQTLNCQQSGEMHRFNRSRNGPLTSKISLYIYLFIFFCIHILYTYKKVNNKKDSSILKEKMALAHSKFTY